MKTFTLTIVNMVYNTRQVISGFKSEEEAFAYYEAYFDDSFEYEID